MNRIPLQPNEFASWEALSKGNARQAVNSRNSHLDDAVINSLVVAGRTTCGMLLKSRFPRIVNVEEMYSHG